MNTVMIDPPKVVTNPITNRARRSLAIFTWPTPLLLRHTGHQQPANKARIQPQRWFCNRLLTTNSRKVTFNTIHSLACWNSVSYAFQTPTMISTKKQHNLNPDRNTTRQQYG